VVGQPFDLVDEDVACLQIDDALYIAVEVFIDLPVLPYAPAATVARIL